MAAAKAAAVRSHRDPSVHTIRLLPIVLLSAGVVSGAGGSLVLSPGSVSGSSVSLNMALASAGSQPAGIQWTLTYSSGNIASVTASTAAAGKTISCASSAGTYTCLVVGRNSTAIADGVIATFTVTLAGGVSSASIGVTNTQGATFDGQPLAFTGTGGTINSGVTSVAPPPPAAPPPTTPAQAPTLVGLSCTPPTLAAGAAGTCTVNLSKTGGGSVTLASNNKAVTVPTSVTVGSGATSASFNASAGSFTSDGTATITATMNGTSKTASIGLATPITVSALACAPSTLTAGGSSTCTVTLTKSGGATVKLASNSTSLTVPGSVTVGATSITATFTATAGSISATVVATVSALLNGSSQGATITLRTGQTGISSFGCQPDSRLSGTLDCTLQLTETAPSGGIPVSLQASGSRLQLPGSVRIGQGQQSTTFTVRVTPSDQDAQFTITASAAGVTRSTTVSVTGTRPTAVNFSSNTITAGTMLSGEIRVTSSNVPDTVVLTVTSSTPDVLVPSSVVLRQGQTRATFTAFAGARSKHETAQISVTFGHTSVRSTLTVLTSRVPHLQLPHNVVTRVGEAATFTVDGFDPELLPLAYSVNGLPSGAQFDDTTGTFSWTPDPSQQGSYDLMVTATDSEQASSSGPVTIVVGSGKPSITGVVNAASVKGPVCSGGSLASLQGRWLNPDSSGTSDPSGDALELAGTRVNVNGAYAAVVYASSERVDFVCPALDPGTQMTISVETAAGAADPITAAVAPIAPGLFTLDGSGSGQGVVYLADQDPSLLATSRDYQELGQPAQSGDLISIRATGIGPADGLPPIVMLGGFLAEVDSVQAVPGMAGVSEITIRVPPGVAEGSNVELVVAYPDPAGASKIVHHPAKTGIRSNTITVAIEWPQ
jgi:uncharacterized protein (TIGR03437 family)